MNRRSFFERWAKVCGALALFPTSFFESRQVTKPTGPSSVWLPYQDGRVISFKRPVVLHLLGGARNCQFRNVVEVRWDVDKPLENCRFSAETPEAAQRLMSTMSDILANRVRAAIGMKSRHRAGGEVIISSIITA